MFSQSDRSTKSQEKKRLRETRTVVSETECNLLCCDIPTTHRNNASVVRSLLIVIVAISVFGDLAEFSSSLSGHSSGSRYNKRLCSALVIPTKSKITGPAFIQKSKRKIGIADTTKLSSSSSEGDTRRYRPSFFFEDAEQFVVTEPLVAPQLYNTQSRFVRTTTTVNQPTEEHLLEQQQEEQHDLNNLLHFIQKPETTTYSDSDIAVTTTSLPSSATVLPIINFDDLDDEDNGEDDAEDGDCYTSLGSSSFPLSPASSSPQFGLSNPVCRVVTRSDSKLPTSLNKLPKSLTTPLNRDHPPLLKKLDDIFHWMAHDQTRQLRYMDDEPTFFSSVLSSSSQLLSSSQPLPSTTLTSLETGTEDAKEGHTAFDQQEEERLVKTVRGSLEDAGFQLLSRRDLDLCESLNAGYLLRLSLLPDLSELDHNLAREFYPERFLNEIKNEEGGKRSSSSLLDIATRDELLFDGRVLIFWRGYSQEVSKGRLLLPKIDYLQASIVQRSAAWLRRTLNDVETSLVTKTYKLGVRITRAVHNGVTNLVSRVSSKQLQNNLRLNVLVNTTASISESVSSASRLQQQCKGTMLDASSGKLFKLSRYGGSKIRFVGSPNPTDALNPFVICEEGFCPDAGGNCSQSNTDKVETINNGGTKEWDADINGIVERDMYEVLNEGGLQCPYDEETDMLQQRSRPGEIPVPVGISTRRTPMQLLKRVSISSLVDFFTKDGRRHLLQTIVGKSELVEPTYEEVVVLWRPKPKPEDTPRLPVWTPPPIIYDLADMFEIDGLPEPPAPPKEEPPKPLEIRAFSGVPMANLPAVLPKTKLVFRPADAFVFDFVSLISFLLVIGSQKFDNPKLDLLALVSVSLWIIRTFFRYSNKLARYELLVKKFLTSKISHRNRGAVKYIASEAGTQRAVRAALVHDWLSSIGSLSSSPSSRWVKNRQQPTNRSDLVERGENEVNKLIQDFKRTPVDINAALNDLEDLNLLTTKQNGDVEVVSDSNSVSAAVGSVWSEVFRGKRNTGSRAGRRKGP